MLIHEYEMFYTVNGSADYYNFGIGCADVSVRKRKLLVLDYYYNYFLLIFIFTGCY